MMQAHLPLGSALIPKDTFIGGCCSFFSVVAVPGILLLSCGSKVGLSIIESVAINVINDHAGRGGANDSMHILVKGLSVPESSSFSIISATRTDSLPIVPIQSFKIVLVNLCVFAACQFNPAKGISVTHPAIQKNNPYRNSNNNCRNRQ